MYGKINRGQVSCPLYRGCPLFGGSIIRGFTVEPLSLAEKAVQDDARNKSHGSVYHQSECEGTLVLRETYNRTYFSTDLSSSTP